MPLIYNVTIEPVEKENLFHITWQKKGTDRKNGFNQKAGHITRDEVERLWLLPGHQLTVGKKLFNFLDGDNRYLRRALDQAKLGLNMMKKKRMHFGVERIKGRSELKKLYQRSKEKKR